MEDPISDRKKSLSELGSTIGSIIGGVALVLAALISSSIGSALHSSNDLQATICWNAPSASEMGSPSCLGHLALNIVADVLSFLPWLLVPLGVVFIGLGIAAAIKLRKTES
jgi:hypothetical protein